MKYEIDNNNYKLYFFNFIFELIHSSYLPPNYNFQEDFYNYSDQAEKFLQEYEVSSEISSPGLRHGPYNNCQDEKNNCDTWAKQGECESNPNYMLSNCRKSCGNCMKFSKVIELLYQAYHCSSKFVSKYKCTYFNI